MRIVRLAGSAVLAMQVLGQAGGAHAAQQPAAPAAAAKPDASPELSAEAAEAVLTRLLTKAEVAAIRACGSETVVELGTLLREAKKPLPAEKRAEAAEVLVDAAENASTLATTYLDRGVKTDAQGRTQVLDADLVRKARELNGTARALSRAATALGAAK